MHNVTWWPVVAMVVVATITDLHSLKIPNWLVFPFMAGGVAFSAFLHGWAGAGRSLSGFILGVAVCGVLAFLRAMGMGDVKLCAAIGTWIGPAQLMTALLFTGIAGALLAVGWSIYGGFWREMVHNCGSLVAHFGRRGIKPHPALALDNPKARRMAYAPAIAIGTLASFFAG